MDRQALAASPYANDDLLPTTFEERRWNLWHIAALWIGMAVCIPTYMLAAGLIPILIFFVEHWVAQRLRDAQAPATG